jgi:HK97 family phage portal protein
VSARRHRGRRPRRLAAAAPVAGPAITQPYNRVVWPHEALAAGAPVPAVYDVRTAMRIPGVGKAVGVIAGQIMQAPMDAYKGVAPLARPRLLEQPDPNESRSWFVACQVEDYLCEGNAVHYVTVRGPTGWPAAGVWIPAAWVSIAVTDRDWTNAKYLVGGVELERRNVVHVKRSADRWNPARGVGVVEQHLASLDRVAMQEEYERRNLADGAVPSTAVITPNPALGQDEAEAAKVAWMAKYLGPGRQPAILPAGTQVIPLAWSPSDAQMTEARQFSLTDLANIFCMDPFWLGGQAAGLTYKSPGPMYTHLLRVTLGPVLTAFEQMWSAAWLPRGQSVVFDRQFLQRDDLASSIHTLVEATTATPPLMSVGEARTYMGWPPEPTGPAVGSPVDTAPPATAEEEP